MGGVEDMSLSRGRSSDHGSLHTEYRSQWFHDKSENVRSYVRAIFFGRIHIATRFASVVIRNRLKLTAEYECAMAEFRKGCLSIPKGLAGRTVD